MGISIQIDGLAETNKYLKSKNKKALNLIQKGLSNSAIYVQGEVKYSIAGNRAEKRSVDTGRFLNSVGVLIKPLYASVYSLVSYADFLEYGTLKFAGRRHFTNSAARSKQKVRELIKQGLSKL